MAIKTTEVNANPANVHAPAAATAAVVTRTTPVGYARFIDQIWYTYSATPTGGAIQIEDGSGNVVFKQLIPASGVGNIQFLKPMRFSTSATVIVTLASGAGAVVGTLTVSTWHEKA